MPIKMLSFGAGAIGTYIGGSLALAGNPVVFLERPGPAADLRRGGLRLALGGEARRIPTPQTAASLDAALALGPFDVALFALKSYDTDAALDGMRPYVDRLPPVLCLQNGVENEPAIAELLGAEQVIAGTVTSAIGRAAAGEITLERLRGVGVADSHPLSRRLVDAFDAAGLQPRLYSRAADMKWSKLLTNLVSNATSAILDLSPAEVFAHHGLFRLEMAQLREALQVMAGLEAAVVDLPGTPVRLLAWGSRLPEALARPLMRGAVGSGRGGKMPSLHIDLHGGRGRTEVDYLNGAVVRYGERLGVETPVNRLLRDTLMGLSEGRIAVDQYARRPETLLAAFSAG